MAYPKRRGKEDEVEKIEKEFKVAEREVVGGLHKFEKVFIKEGEVVEHDVLHAGRRLRKFGLLEIVEVFLGAIILLTILAYQGQIWIWGITAPWNIVLIWNAAILITAYILLYISGYIRAKTHHVLVAHSVTVRLAATYAICFILVAAYLTLFRGGEWFTAPDLAIKQIFVLIVPALIGGALTDFLLE